MNMKLLLISTLLFAVFSIGVQGHAVASDGDRLGEIDISKRDQGTGDDIFLGPCSEDDSIDAIAGGYCDVVKPLDPCVPDIGTCGWGTRRIRYYCGQNTRLECSCEAICFVPCDHPLSMCLYHYHYDCVVVKHSPCSKTCGVGYKQIEYKCYEHEAYYHYKCLEECCCMPYPPGLGVIEPTKVCQGKNLVAVEDRRKCCPFTFFPA